MKRYSTTLVITLTDEKIEELKEEYECEDETDIENACFDYIEEVMCELTDCGGNGCDIRPANSILTFDEV